MEWMQPFFNAFTKCFPTIHFVWPNEGGVFIRKGEYLATVSPGMYLCWPYIDEIWKVVVKRQIINLPDQSVLSNNEIDTAASGAVEYDIIDAKKVLLDLQNFDKSIQNFALGIISKYIRSHECKSSVIDEIETEVLQGLKTKEDEWGIEFTNFWMTDFGKNKIIRMMSDGKVTAIVDE